MKNRLYSLSIAITLLLSAGLSKAQVVVVQSGANASVFSNLDDAMNAASPGDYLYLSGDLFLVHGIQSNSPDSISFYKPLHFIGAGINADSTSVTHQTRIQASVTSSNLSGAMLIGSAADGSTFDGIIFSGASLTCGNGATLPDSAGHFIFTRCYMTSFDFYPLGGGPAPTNLNIEFHECIIPVGVGNAGVGNTRCTIDRCIIMSNTQVASAAVTVSNSVLASTPGAGTINNCIIYSSNFVNQFGAVFNNCLIGGVMPTGGSDVFNSCTFGINDSAIFVNAPTQTYAAGNDYHLAVGSPAIGYGNDGHDAGIYGTATPAKPGNVPYNPHYTGATIPTSTDASGNLNINIHVAAQSY